MFCAFFKKSPPESLDPSKLVYYQNSGRRAILSLNDDDFETLCDIQGRNFSVTHKPSGRVVQTHADTAIDYWASVIAAVDQIRIIVEMEAFKL